MKKLLIFSLLTIYHLDVYAQNEVFRIDSISQQRILLDKGGEKKSEVVNPDSNFRKRNDQFSKSTQDSNVGQGALMLTILNIGFFLVLSIIHFCLFLVYKKQKANFFFFIAAISAVISSSFYSFSLFNIDPNITNADQNTLPTIFTTISSTFLFIAIHSLNNIRKNIFFWLILGFAVIVIFFQIINADLGGILGFFLLVFSRFLVLRLSITTYLSGNKSFVIVIAGLIVFWVLSAVLILFGTSYFLNMKINSSFSIKDLVFLACNWSIPISMLIYISREFGNNSINLERKLIEVQQLSLEKQETLQKQNAELQAALLKGQTIERQRVAADLHDNLGSTLSALWLNVDMIDKSKMNTEEKEIHQNLRENLEKAYNDVRLLSHNLLPEEFEKQGLVPTLQGFVRKISKN
ncbi:hypothetical protein EGI22_14960, partial [Lacihabitans sp. LS3-19]